MAGINLYPWGFDRTTDPLFSPDYLKGLAATGFDGVRVLYDVAPVISGTIPSSYLGWRVVEAAERCLAAGITRVVACMAPNEGVPGYGADAICTDPTKIRTYRSMVREVVHRLEVAGLPQNVAVELMNEPLLWGDGGPATDATRRSWGPIQHQIYEDCRAQDSARGLIVTGPCSSWAFGLPYFDPTPYVADTHVQVSGHWYGFDDVKFSHQGASWVQATAHLHGLKWSGQTASVERDLSRFKVWAQRHGLAPQRIVINEFGVLRSRTGAIGAALSDAAQFLSDVRHGAEALGFTWYVYADGPGAFVTADTGFSLRKVDGSQHWEPTLLNALGLDPGR